ncbi:retrotransposon hot spot (RHS) protein [Trypanosoma cruzi]|nr:retrotransposon hot spot (RHS) protein [Trypanosoma cruzi]
MQIALFSVVCGITVMHRCCGVYDLCFCQGLCAHGLLSSVCGVGGATRVRTVASGMRERTLRVHHVAVIVGSLQHCSGWLAPTRRRCGGPRACGVHRVLCRRTARMALLLWLPVMTVTFGYYSYSFFD